MRTLGRLVTVLVVLAVVAPPAQAAFPGRNGAIGYVFSTSGADQPPSVATDGLAAKRLRATARRDLVRCERTDGVPSGGDCTVTQFRSPSYSADGRRIVFDAGSQIGIVSASGGAVTLLGPVTSDDGEPAFSPDGRRIVFTGANDRGGTDLYVYRLGSMFVRPIVNDARSPAWSSRNEIAWVRDGNIYVSNRKGNRRRFVTSGVSPDWSPGGGRLVFVRPSPRNTFAIDEGRMFTIGARGHRLTRYLRTVRDASSPSWSPDGRWIAFDRAFAGILAQRLHPRGEAQLVEESQFSGEGGSVNFFHPAWRPRPR